MFYLRGMPLKILEVLLCEQLCHWPASLNCTLSSSAWKDIKKKQTTPQSK